MTQEQRLFLLFHVRHRPVQWRWHMRGTQLRVKSEHGQGATISRSDLSELLEAGLMQRGIGEIVEITDAGRKAERANAEAE